MKRSRRKQLVAQLDKLFSTYIRIRDKRRFGGCCAFGCGPIECCFHFVTRSKHSVRWDERNAVGACHAANFINEFNPHEYAIWYINNRGATEYERLVSDSHRIAKFSLSDLEAIRDDLKQKLEKVALNGR